MVLKGRIKITVHGTILQILLFILLFGSCDWGVPDYKLNVITEEGVIGTPDAGEHSYKDLDEVNYEYTPINPVHTVEVFINDIRQKANGTFSMYTDVTLIARLVDIRGSWRVQMQKSNSTSVNYDFTITFNGAGVTSGTFSDDRGYHGLWTAENGTVTITFTDWNFFVLIGGIYEMSGTFTGEGTEGGWNAARL
jgi:hypothetical protein